MITLTATATIDQWETGLLRRREQIEDGIARAEAVYGRALVRATRTLPRTITPLLIAGSVALTVGAAAVVVNILAGVGVLTLAPHIIVLLHLVTATSVAAAIAALFAVNHRRREWQSRQEFADEVDNLLFAYKAELIGVDQRLDDLKVTEVQAAIKR